MKYNEKNKPLVCMQTTSRCYKGTRKMEIKGVLWHDTGANNPNIKRYVQPSDNAPDRAEMLALLGKNQYNNDWNHTDRQAGMNCWVGKLADGTVATVQTMPWDYRPWGCGSGSKGSCNDGWLQFEICEDGKNDASYLEAAYKEACEITAYLCKMFGIDPHGTVDFKGMKVPTILCHQDSYKLGLGSNHSDIYDWFPKFGKSMETARDDVAALLAADGTSAPVAKEGLTKAGWPHLRVGTEGLQHPLPLLLGSVPFQLLPLQPGLHRVPHLSADDWLVMVSHILLHLHLIRLPGDHIPLRNLPEFLVAGIDLIFQDGADSVPFYRLPFFMPSR